MPRYINPPVPKTPHLVEAEKSAQDTLRRYFRRELGTQAAISRQTGIAPPLLSRMSKNGAHITLEYALRIELATGGELRAEWLCPSRAELLDQFLKLRCPAEASA